MHEEKNGDEAGAEAGRKKEARQDQRRAAEDIFRVMFNEITPKAIKAAFEHPGEINENLVDAQQARRVLDRWSATKFRRCCGTRSAADFPPGACRPSRCA